MLDAHWIITSGLGLVAFLLWQMFLGLRADVKALTDQNGSQERELATLKTSTAAHEAGFERLARAVERLDDKLDELIGRRSDRATGGRQAYKRER